MAKYKITRKEALEKMYCLRRDLIKGIDLNEPLNMAIDALAIDIVFCEECEYSKVYSLHSDVCPQRWCEKAVPKIVADDDYCSWGDRRKK